jgi:diguanylate cyclase (GGDEF)-like protein/PAS domain S-box-containing protein
MKRLLARWRHWLVLLACLGSFGGYLVLNARYEHDQIDKLERERLATQAKVVADSLTRQLNAVKLSLQSISEELPNWRKDPEGHDEAIRYLKSMGTALTAVRTYMVLDAQGVTTLANREALIGQDFSRREYFSQPRKAPDPKILFVSAPFQSVLGNFVIFVSRAIVDSEGNFAGVVTAALDPATLQELLASIHYADDMSAMIVHGDGKVFLLDPPLPDMLGKDLSHPGTFFGQHLRSARANSAFEGPAFSSGEPSLSVLRTLQPTELAMDKPLVIEVSRHTGPLFDLWEHGAISQFFAYLLLSFFSSIGLLVYQRLQSRQRANNQRLKLATEAAGVGIWEFNLSQRRYHWDSAMFGLFGLNPQARNERNDDWHQLLLPGELERIKNVTRAVLKTREPMDLTFQIRRPDGELRFMRNRAALHCDDVDVPKRLIGTTEDVTQRKTLEADLRVAATAFDCQEGIVVTDPKLTILRVNRAFSGLLGYSAQEAVGQTPKLLQSGRHDKAFYSAMWADIVHHGAWQGEIWNRRKNGEVFPEWLSISVVRNDEGAVTHYVGTHTDITLRKAAEDEIKHLAFYDPLTRLPNRRLLQDRLNQAVIQARRSNALLALMFIDLDRFKPVNDQFGHHAGDELLQGVAQRLQDCVRESDTVARIGGDEFVVLLPGIEATQAAVHVMEKIHTALQQAFTLSDGTQVSISSSAGIAIYPEHGADEASLLAHADDAMYQAKTSGRDRFLLYQPAPPHGQPSRST